MNTTTNETRWQRWHRNGSPEFLTDNGAACPQCGIHCYGFKAADESRGRTLFDAFCYGCHAASRVAVVDFDADGECPAAAISAAMRAANEGGAS